METEYIKSELIEQIKKAFFGEIPEPFSFLNDDALMAYCQFFIKHKDANVYTLNYAEFIEELLGVLMPSLKYTLENREQPSEEDMARFRKMNRIFYGVQFYKVMEDQGQSLDTKADLCHFMHKFLDIGTKMYGIDMVENQASFLEDILAAQNNILIHREAPQLELPVSETRSIGNHNTKQLSDLSSELFKAEIIAGKDSFVRVYDSGWSVADGLCNWNGKITSLMFLLTLLDDNIEERKNIYLHLVEERFIFKDGKKRDLKNLRVALNQVEKAERLNENDLEGEQSLIYRLYKKTFLT